MASYGQGLAPPPSAVPKTHAVSTIVHRRLPRGKGINLTPAPPLATGFVRRKLHRKWFTAYCHLTARALLPETLDGTYFTSRMR